jgi:type IV secretory pathway TraG/TraD family ATPase VirD4
MSRRFTTNQPSAAGDPETILLYVLLGVFAVVEACAAFVWTVAQLAGLATHGRWPGLPFAAATGAALRLPGTLGEPAAAWPPEYRTRLSGPIGFHIAATLLLAVLVVVAVVVVRLILAKAPGLGRRRAQPWARPSDLRALLLRAPARGRLILGHVGRRILATEQRRSVMVVAPSQAGKTTRIVIPNVRAWDGPLVVTSVKPDVLHATRADRTRRGDVLVFDPTGSTGETTVKWSPLLACATYADAERTARWLVDAATDSRPSENARFWESLGAKLLAPLLFAAAGTGRQMTDVARWVDRRAATEPEAALLTLADSDALDAWAASRSREERQRDSVYATAETVLRAFTSPTVRTATTVEPEDLAAGHAFDVARFLDSHATLYLVAPAHEQARLRPLFEAVVQSVLREAHTRHAASGVPLDPPLLLMLDEAANIAPIRDLAQHLSTGAGQGVQLCTVWQDLAQVQALYGEQARTIVNNHAARLFLSGNADLTTLTSLSQIIGDVTSVRSSSTVADRGRSTTYSEHTERAAPVDQLRQLPADTAVLLYGRVPPIRVKLLPPAREASAAPM